MLCAEWQICPCVSATRFAVPVVPEVRMRMATSVSAVVDGTIRICALAERWSDLIGDALLGSSSSAVLAMLPIAVT